MNVDLHFLLDGKWDEGTRPKDLFDLHVRKKPTEYVELIVRGLRSNNRRIENGCAELSSLLSEQAPELLYPHLDLYAENLAATLPVLRWEAACTIGNLAAADSRRKSPGFVPQLTRLLHDKSIVLQGHAAKALAKIARAYPDQGPEILEELLKAKGKFPGNRIGYLVEAMESFLDRAKLRGRIRGFISPLVHSEVSSVARKAKRVLKLLDGPSPRKPR